MKKIYITRWIFRRRTWKVICALLLLYLAVAIGYYFLPWSVRKPIYKIAPTIDRTLQKSGYHLIQDWDILALTGHDVETKIDGTERGERVYAGRPLPGKQNKKRIKILENLGYTVGYSESMKDPLWVTYRLFDVQHLWSGPRESHFSVDLRTHAKVKSDDYKKSGFDRGHMAPNYGIATRYGVLAQKETFLMSNVIPQTPRVNRRIWEDLEHKVATRYGRYFGEVWVITGPVFEKPIEKLDAGISIPSHYYKIIADEHDGKIRVMAFLIGRHCPPYTRIKSHLVSVDKIEELTGLNFFPNMPESSQKELESEAASRLWPTIIPALRYYFMGTTD